MDNRSRIRLSKAMSLLLRHRPEAGRLSLDENGWCGVDELIAALRFTGHRADRAMIEEVVARCEKQRFTLAAGRIRASQGHSITVDLQLEERVPPDRLYHGTVERFLESILEEGLKRGQRHHVHLSGDVATAKRVGARRGRAVILEVDARAMLADGILFYVSANGVWLTETVPPNYLRVIDA